MNSNSIIIGLCLLGGGHFHHGKFVQFHSKYNETYSELGCILV
jgi:hypothetical protein